jgi:hypothetical protein
MLCIECNTHAAISLREAPLNSALAPQISCAPLWRWPLFQKCTDALPRVSVSQIARHCLARDSIRLRFVNLCSWREGGSVRGGGLAGRSVCVCVGGGGAPFRRPARAGHGRHPSPCGGPRVARSQSPPPTHSPVRAPHQLEPRRNRQEKSRGNKKNKNKR